DREIARRDRRSALLGTLRLRPLSYGIALVDGANTLQHTRYRCQLAHRCRAQRVGAGAYIELRFGGADRADEPHDESPHHPHHSFPAPPRLLSPACEHRKRRICNLHEIPENDLSPFICSDHRSALFGGERTRTTPPPRSLKRVCGRWRRGGV